MATMKHNIMILDPNTRFPFWQVKMQAVLIQMNLDGALLGFNKISSSWYIEEKKRMDRKAISQIHLHLPNHIF